LSGFYLGLLFSGVAVCTVLLVPFCCCMLCVFPSLSTPQAQALSCVESLCCYQHGQSGCSRLARLLEQMTGQCKASPSDHKQSLCCCRQISMMRKRFHRSFR
uniref:Uncharacterized protein n=1 Tax=Poecilia mexicana TaxID=48701 RepID=A0A3B3X104_9TELE